MFSISFAGEETKHATQRHQLASKPSGPNEASIKSASRNSTLFKPRWRHLSPAPLQETGRPFDSQDRAGRSDNLRQVSCGVTGAGADIITRQPWVIPTRCQHSVTAGRQTQCCNPSRATSSSVRPEDVIGFAFFSHGRLILPLRSLGSMANSRVGEPEKQGRNSGGEFWYSMSSRAAQTRLLPMNGAPESFGKRRRREGV